MPKVVLFHLLTPETAAWLLSLAPEGFVTAAVHHQAPQEEKAAALRDADFVTMLPAMPLPEPLLAMAPRLKLVQVMGAGYDPLDLGLLARYNVALANAGGANAVAVAEHTIALLLALYKQLLERDRTVRQGQWPPGIVVDHGAFEVAGKTVGYVGLGNIGREVARRLGVWETRQLYYKRTRLSEAEEAALGVTHAPLEEVLRQADIVSLHCNLTAETRGLIGERELGLMKCSAVLINTSRGAVVDQAALVQALKKRRIAGAALDVFDGEPLDPASPLTRLDNVVLTPHSGGNTADTWPRYTRIAYGNLLRVLEGQPPLSLVQGWRERG